MNGRQRANESRESPVVEGLGSAACPDEIENLHPGAPRKHLAQGQGYHEAGSIEPMSAVHIDPLSLAQAPHDVSGRMKNRFEIERQVEIAERDVHRGRAGSEHRPLVCGCHDMVDAENFERQMDGAKLLKCSEFASAMISNM